MRNYPEVPDWWYALSFCVFFSLAIVAMEVGLSAGFACAFANPVSRPGLAYTSPRLGADPRGYAADHIYPTVGFHLCNDGTRGAVGRFH